MVKPDASLHSNCLLHDDARGRVDTLLHILNVHPSLQGTVHSEAPRLDDGLVHLRLSLIHHQVCPPCVDIRSRPPFPQLCLQVRLAPSISAPSLTAARNIVKGGGRVAVVHADQHSGDRPLRLSDLHRATVLPSTPLHPLHPWIINALRHRAPHGFSSTLPSHDETPGSPGRRLADDAYSDMRIVNGLLLNAA